MSAGSINSEVLEKLLSNKVIEIYITNMLHLMEIGLLSQAVCREYVSGVAKRIQDMLGAPTPEQIEAIEDKNAIEICTSIVCPEHSDQGVADLSELEAVYSFGTVYALGALEALHPTLVRNVKALQAADSKSNTKNFRPLGVPAGATESEVVEQLVDSLIQASSSGKVSFIMEKKTHIWVAPVETRLDAKSARDKLGLDHIPRDEKPRSRRLLRLEIPLDTLRERCSFHRPTVLDSPSPRFRAFTRRERETSCGRLLHGMTVDLESYKDGFAEFVAKFHRFEFRNWKLVDLGSVDGRHPNALDHQGYLDDLNSGVLDGSGFRRLATYSVLDGLNSLFQLSEYD